MRSLFYPGKTKTQSWRVFFTKNGRSSPPIVNFRSLSNKHRYHFEDKLMWKNGHLEIRCLDLNTVPLDCEFHHITFKPGHSPIKGSFVSSFLVRIGYLVFLCLSVTFLLACSRIGIRTNNLTSLPPIR